MDSLDVNKVLPKGLTIKSVDNHLYKFGLNYVKTDESIRRDFIHKPILIVTVCGLQVFKNIYNLLNVDINLFVYLGDWPRLLGMRYHYNIAALLVAILGLCSH